ncbi:class I SAM-dependent methyltransferase [Algihabitans albus]|uniref:class I SAM-dependent methyltransferase n=1 Tax=Algihabitans albus TaxID=2164067 RepID=UPI001ABD15C8|nr:class I SAM-dependent methyltransferase [Algihabitans albus]
MTDRETPGAAGLETPGPPDPEWYRSFFTGLAVEMWRQAVPDTRVAAEVDLAADLLDLDEGDAVLDAPCGTGRHALELAARGYAPTAIDLSNEALEELRTAAAASGLELDLRQLDLRALPFEGLFPGAVCLGNSFGYFPPDGCRSVLEGFGRALRPGGRLLLHSAMAAECLLPGLAPRVELQIGDVAVTVENRYLPLAGRLDTRYSLARGEERMVRDASHWVFTIAELGRMMTEANLAVTALFADGEGADFILGESDEVYFLAEKYFKSDR